jgi:Ca2+:H+ antiporter
MSLVGGIVTVTILNIGISFCVGGYNRCEQFFSISIGKLLFILLNFGLAGIVISFTFHIWTNSDNAAIARVSRVAAVLLTATYFVFLYFQLRSHRNMMEPRGQKEQKLSRKTNGSQAGVRKCLQ